MANPVYDACCNLGWLPAPAPMSLTIAGKIVVLTDADASEFTVADMRAEQRLLEIVPTPRFRRATKDQRIAMLRSEYQSARDGVKARLRAKYGKL